LRHREWVCPDQDIIDILREADPDSTLIHIEEQTGGAATKVWHISEWRLSSERKTRLREEQKQDNMNALVREKKRSIIRAKLYPQCKDNEQMLNQMVQTCLNNPIASKMLYGIDLDTITEESL
jgi:hypothetical protein